MANTRAFQNWSHAQPLELPPLIVTAWHTVHGFCTSIPADLEDLCREIEISGVSGAMHREVSMHRYVYWSWKSAWIIVAGYNAAYSQRRDTLLLNSRLNSRLKPSLDTWIEPPSIIDFGLGDSLLSSARANLSNGAYTPPLSNQ